MQGLPPVGLAWGQLPQRLGLGRLWAQRGPPSLEAAAAAQPAGRNQLWLPHVLRQRAAPVDWHFAGPAALGLERLVQGGVLGAELSDVGPVEGLSVKGASRAVPGSRWGGPWAGGSLSQEAEGSLPFRVFFAVTF